MQNKSFIFNIFASILLLASFLCEIIVGAEIKDALFISGACVLLASLAFAITAMCTGYPLLSAGALTINCISFFLTACLSEYSAILIDCLQIWDYALLMVISSYLMIPLSNMLIISFLVGSRKKAETSQCLQTNHKHKETIGFVEELQSLKTLLDNEILSRQEFDAQKQNILKKYGLTISEKKLQPEIKSEKPMSPNLPATYKCGNGIQLVVQNNKYSFVQTEGNKLLFGGVAEISQDNKKLTLHRTNAPDITMEICSDGLKLPNGGKYTKIK